MSGFRPMPGSEFHLAGKWYRVDSYNPARRCLTLVDSDGVLTTIAIEDLVSHPSLEVSGDTKAPIDLVASLSTDERAVILRRMEHVNEALTGYRSGNPDHALPHEPHPRFDPATTFKKDRFAAKLADLDNEFARRAGEYMSISTMRRLEKMMRDGTALQGTVEGKRRRRSAGRRAIPKGVEEEIIRLVDTLRHDTNMTQQGMHAQVLAATAKRFGDKWTEENFPSYTTFWRYLHDNWTPSELNGKARTRASRTDAPKRGFHRTNPTRPGQIVFMDTNNLDVLLKGTAIDGAVRGSLVVALDAYSRSVLAVRVVEQSEKDVDVAFAFLDIARPKQMLPGWPEEAAWPFIGLPENIVLPFLTDTEARAAGVSGMPFVNPEALGLDHGNTYKSVKMRQLAQRYHVDLLPARVRTGSDKAFIERFFGAMRSMLLEHLKGYRGTDTSERGREVDNDVEWTAQRLEDCISKWAVLDWQTHIMDDVKPPWCCDGDWSPNALFEHGMSAAGLVPRVFTSEDYYAALKTSHVKVQSRGVKVLGLWFDNDPDGDDPEFLDGYRNRRSATATGLWMVHYDRRDLRHVYFVDENGERHTLRWVGATGDFPCFGERHLQALRRRVGSSLHLNDKQTLVHTLLTEILPQRDIDTWTASDKRADTAASKTARDQELAAADAAKFGVHAPTDNTADPTPRTALETHRRNRREAAANDEEVAAAPVLGSSRNRLLG